MARDHLSAEPAESEPDTLLVDLVRSMVLCRREDWTVQPSTFWCHVHPLDVQFRPQGWKLHLSATPLSAPLVLARAAEVLIRAGCSFKFAATVDRVAELGSRHAERGKGGKFITAYPGADDDRLRSLADALHRATEGLPGPGILSDRPYRPGSLVHYRYGVHRGVPMLGNDGFYEAMLTAPDGRLLLDRREGWYAPPPWAPPDPIRSDPPPTNPQPGGSPRAVLLNGRYAVREVIQHRYTGGVYRGTDRTSGGQVVIKQGRAHTGGDLSGRDIQDRRRHEAAMLRAFDASGRTPRLVDVFDQQGDLFLVQEAVPGVTLRRWVADTIALDEGASWGPDPVVADQMAHRLVDLVALAHREGRVLRDFTPDNVMVTGAGELCLIDLEMLARPGDLVALAYTPGYGAPEQMSAPKLAPAPELSADLYSLGAVLFHLATGVDPVLPRDDPPTRTLRQRIDQWLHHLAPGNPVLGRLAPVVVALMDVDPQRRPGLDTVRVHLSEQPTGTWSPPPAQSPAPRRSSPTDLDRLIQDMVSHLLDTMNPDDRSSLWPLSDVGERADRFNVHHGAAGPLAVLTRAYVVGPRPELRAVVTTAADWITRWVDREPRILPGLYFGRSGTAWALLEAGRALADSDLVRAAGDLARRIPSSWPNPDVCHGAAGAGLTQLRFWEATGDGDFLARASRTADGLVDAAEYRDGRLLWPVPVTFASNLAGVAHYGFAHGVAGIGSFLLAAGRSCGESRFVELAASAAETLVATAEVTRGAAYWPIEPGGPLRTNWCSGSSGVATFLIRMWQENRDDRLAELGVRAAVAVRRSRWHAGTCQCHGLAGDGEFLLDLADASGDVRFRDWAHELAVSIACRGVLRDGRMLAPDETGVAVSADYSTGLSGVLAFLLRLGTGGDRLWLPESLTTRRDDRAGHWPS